MIGNEVDVESLDYKVGFNHGTLVGAVLAALIGAVVYYFFGGAS